MNETEETTDYFTNLGINCTAWLLSGGNQTLSEVDDASSSSLEPEENPSYFSRDYRIVGTFFQGLILLVGVLGNLLVVLVSPTTLFFRSVSFGGQQPSRNVKMSPDSISRLTVTTSHPFAI